MMVPPRIHSSKSFFSRLSSHLSSHRHLSSLAANSKGIFHPPTRDQVARAHLSLRHMWIRSARLYQLEDEANTNPKDAKLQAEYLEVCRCAVAGYNVVCVCVCVCACTRACARVSVRARVCTGGGGGGRRHIDLMAYCVFECMLQAVEILLM